jgi:hypothetical protein
VIEITMFAYLISRHQEYRIGIPVTCFIPPPLCYLCFVLSFHCQTLYHYAESGVPVHEQDLNTQL